MTSRSLLLGVLLLGFAAEARACSVPVFRYALDRWPADAYEVVVFHRGALNGEDQAALSRLVKATPTEGGFANLEVTAVDLDNRPAPALQKLWDAQENATLPWMVVRYPASAKRDETVWASPLTPTSADRLLDSPVRQSISRMIRGGETGVWVLLESGDKAKDDAAADCVLKELRRMPRVLKLPILNQNDPEDRIAPGAKLRISFGFLRLSRTNPAEQALVRMLLKSEEDLDSIEKEPMAFPIFGRARADYALVGKGIVPKNVEEACTRLVGPCTCQVKRLYPGIDLLVRANWTEPPKELSFADFAPAARWLALENLLPAESRMGPRLLGLGTVLSLSFPKRTAAFQNEWLDSAAKVMREVNFSGGETLQPASPGAGADTPAPAAVRSAETAVNPTSENGNTGGGLDGLLLVLGVGVAGTLGAAVVFGKRFGMG